MDPVPAGSGKTMYRLPEVAEHLGVHYMTAYRYVRTGRLPATRVGGTWMVAASDLAAMDAPAPGGRLPPAPGGRAAGTTGRRSARLLERRLLAGDESGALAVVDEALVSWANRTDVYLKMMVPALRSIGDRWAAGGLSVADEHQATATALRIVGRMGASFRERGRRRGTVVVGTPSGERHGIPVAIVADLLRQAGLAVVELGPDVPPEAFARAAAAADQLVAVAVGATLTGNDAAVAAVAAALHAAVPDVPVIVGGAAVNSREAARELGADLWSGSDATGVVAAVRSLPGGFGQAGEPGDQRHGGNGAASGSP